MKKLDSDYQAKIIELIEETIPHGSGIDGKWVIEFNQSLSIICRNDIHKMDQNGYYCGWSPLQVNIDPFSFEWKVVRCPKDYRDYIDETIYHWFSNSLKAPLMGFMGYRGFTWVEAQQIKIGLWQARKVLTDVGIDPINWNETFKQFSHMLNECQYFTERFTNKEIK